MTFAWSAKDPDEEYEYTHDWADRLLVETSPGVFTDVGDTLLLPDDPDPNKRPTLDVIEGDVVLGDIVPVPATQKLQYWVSGGTVAGGKCKLTGTVHTQQGRTYQESFTLPIKQR